MTQIAGGVIYQFTGWSDGSDRESCESSMFRTRATTFVADYKAAGIVPPVTVSSVPCRDEPWIHSEFHFDLQRGFESTTAQKASGYWVVLPGRDHRFGTRDDRIVKFRKAVYQGSSETVKLTPDCAMAANSSVEIVVSGSAAKPHPTDVWGRPIDGNRMARPAAISSTLLRRTPAQARANPKARHWESIRADHGAQKRL